MQQDGWQLRIILINSSEDSTQILLSPTTPHIENGRTKSAGIRNLGNKFPYLNGLPSTTK